MTTANSLLPGTTNSSRRHIQNWFSRMWAFNWFLTLSVMLYVVAIPIYLIAAVVDPRLITNAPAFVKPLKFVVSIAIYLATFLWFSTMVQKGRRWVHFAGNVTAIGLLLEIILITGQAIRGVPSHFNQATPFDQMVFNIMGMAIVVVSVMNLILGILLLIQRLPDPVMAWGLRFGVFISLVGMLVAFLMTGTPSPDQRAQLAAGETPTSFGAHSVGVEDGGEGLPFLGWSTEGGDLRIPHFVGLHAMQALPLLALALTRRRQLNQRQRLILVATFGLAYLGWVALLTWQALRGQPLLSPDMLTLSAYAALIGIVAVLVGVTLTWFRPTSMPAMRA